MGSVKKDEIRQLEKVDKMPVQFDPENPELTETELKKFHRARGKKGQKKIIEQNTV